MSNTKVMSAKAAIETYVKDGDCIAVGGFVTNRRPYVLIRELIRQNKRDLYVEGGSAGGDIDMLIGADCVKAIMVSYIANSGYTQVGRRFRERMEQGTLLFEDYSLDVQAIAYHGAALGLSYVPVKNMLGSDLEKKWGMSQEERKKHPKLPAKKFVIQQDPFEPESRLCCVPTPKIDVAFIHAQAASPDGTVRIEGAPFLDVDLAMAAKHTIVSCEEIISNEQMHSEPERNSITGLCVDAVVHAPYGAHPSQCAHFYDYDTQFFRDYDVASKTQQSFDSFIEEYVFSCPEHMQYLDKLGMKRLLALKVHKGYGYVPGLHRK